jgi:hypothetical protein
MCSSDAVLYYNITPEQFIYKYFCSDVCNDSEQWSLSFDRLIIHFLPV